MKKTIIKTQFSEFEQKLFYLAIFLLAFNATLSGILLIYFLLRSLFIKAIPELFFSKKTLLLIQSFFIYSSIQTLWTNQKLFHIGGLIGHYLIYVLVFFICSKTLISEQKINSTLKAISLSGFFISIIGILSYFNYQINYKFFFIPIYSGAYLFDFSVGEFTNRASSFSMNPNILSAYLIISSYISLYIYRLKENNSFLLNINLFLHSFCFLLTKSRSGYLSFFLTVSLILIINLKNLNLSESFIFFKRRVYYLIPIIFFVFIDFGFFNRIVSIFSLNNNSNFLRLDTWYKGIEIIRNYPLGIGILNFELLKDNYNIKLFHLHNWYLQTYIESGVLGATLFFSFLITFLKKVYYKLNKNDLIIYFMLINLFLFNLTDYIFTDNRVCILLTVLLFIVLKLSLGYNVKLKSECSIK